MHFCCLSRIVIFKQIHIWHKLTCCTATAAGAKAMRHRQHSLVAFVPSAQAKAASRSHRRRSGRKGQHDCRPQGSASNAMIMAAHWSAACSRFSQR